MRVQIGTIPIPRVEQEITVDGSTDRRLWCTNVNITAGFGTSTANFAIPGMLFDEARTQYKDKKVVVKASLGESAKQTIFIGYLTGDGGTLDTSTDECTLSAYSVGHFMTNIGVGHDMNHWEYEYPMVDERTGLFTGYTPLGVLLDVFNRLPDDWTDHVQLGDVSILADASDVPVTSFKFSLQDYRAAIETIAATFGDVAIRERFAQDKTYIDFYKVSSPTNPVSVIKVAHLKDDTADANVARLMPAKAGDQIVNHVQAFGRNQAFVVTVKSSVPGLDFSEQVPEKALRKDWDVTLEPIVKKTPSYASNDRLKYSVVAKEDAGAGSSFKCNLTFDPQVNKTILIHTKTGERMLVTGYTPRVIGDPDAEPPTTDQDAVVTVTRMYQAQEGQDQADIKTNDTFAIEIPGISKVYKDYILPEIFKSFPRKRIQQALPLLDSKREPLETQVLWYKSSIKADATPPIPEEGDNSESKLSGTITSHPTLLTGCRVDLENRRIRLSQPALQIVAKERDPNGKIKTTYAETCVGITLCYVDDRYAFGWDTGTVNSDTELPWGRQTVRVQLEENQHNQLTNNAVGDGQAYPIIDWLGNEWLYGAELINPATGEIISTPATLRYDIAPLKAEAERILSERNRRHISYGIEIDWFETYPLGNRVQLTGVNDYIKDTYTINQVSYSMPVDGDHSTALTIDNTKPPRRNKFKAKGN